MSKINGNDPANPTIETISHDNGVQETVTVSQGLTKREAFAMHIYSGLLVGDHMSRRDAISLAEWAVECADALIEALNK